MMRRALALLTVLGCSTPPPRPEPSAREKKLRELEAASLKPEAFHAFYELRDESNGEAVLLELAYRAPDRAKLVYPGSHRVWFADGVCRFFTEGPRPTYYEVPYLREFQEAETRFAEALKIADEIEGGRQSPQLLFDLGGWDSLRSLGQLKTLILYSLSRSRFAWLRTLRDPAFEFDGTSTFRVDGDGRHRASIEVALDEYGFLTRARIFPTPAPGSLSHPGFTLVRKSLSLEPPADEVFVFPPRGEAIDQSAQAVERLRSTLSDTLERFLVERMADHDLPREKGVSLFAAYYRVDLERTYDPAGMVRLVREGQEKALAFAKREIEESADPAVLRKHHLEKLRVQREANLEQVDAFEDRIQDDYRRFLALILRSLHVGAGRKEEMLLLSDKALSLVTRKVLREPVSKIFDEQISALEKESHP